MTHFNPVRCLTLLLLLLLSLKSVNALAQPACAGWQDHHVGKLHSEATVDLCALLGSQPALIVNTASHCGFTGQFAGLETLHQRYREQGLVVLGVPSNSFRQEAKNAAETAAVCYKNYGVTFTMTEALPVRGSGAHALFRHLGEAAQAPQWNFNKYLIDREGNVRAFFPSHVAPNDPALHEAIAGLL